MSFRAASRTPSRGREIADRDQQFGLTRKLGGSMKFDPLIFKRVFATLLLLGAVVVILSMAYPVRGQTTNSAILTSLQYNLGLLSLLPEPVLDPLLDPPGNFHAVKPQEFDPVKTNLVQAAWLHGTGCPTNATIALPNASFTGVGSFTTYTDPACDP